MASPTIYASFLIRLWREHNLEQAKSIVNCYSEVEHIQSGQRWAFSSLDEMLNFLRQQADDLEISNPSASASGRVRASARPERESDEQLKANHERGGV